MGHPVRIQLDSKKELIQRSNMIKYVYHTRHVEQTAGKAMFDLFDLLHVRTDDFGVENEGNLESLHFLKISHRVKTFQLAMLPRTKVSRRTHREPS